MHVFVLYMYNSYHVIVLDIFNIVTIFLFPLISILKTSNLTRKVQVCAMDMQLSYYVTITYSVNSSFSFYIPYVNGRTTA